MDTHNRMILSLVLRGRGWVESGSASWGLRIIVMRALRLALTTVPRGTQVRFSFLDSGGDGCAAAQLADGTVKGGLKDEEVCVPPPAARAAAHLCVHTPPALVCRPPTTLCGGREQSVWFRGRTAVSHGRR